MGSGVRRSGQAGKEGEGANVWTSDRWQRG